MPINEKQTIKNAKKLGEYPRWREIAHDSTDIALLKIIETVS